MSASEWCDAVVFFGLMMMLVNFVYWRGQVSMLNHWSLK